jgi:hypothetical protein
MKTSLLGFASALVVCLGIAPAALAADMSLKLEIPASWMIEVAKQFPQCRQTLDAAHLRRLGELAVRAGLDDLAYAISTAGLERGRRTTMEAFAGALFEGVEALAAGIAGTVVSSGAEPARSHP